VILPTEKLIFIHIPKTGGASVEDFIIDKLGYERNSLFMTNNLGLLQAHNGLGLTLFPHMHYPLKDVVKIANSSKIKVDNSWTIFSIVRNPYYKLISELFFTDLIPLNIIIIHFLRMLKINFLMNVWMSISLIQIILLVVIVIILYLNINFLRAQI
jgi:hypothetical protein